MVCSSCSKQRADIHTKKSKLIPGMTLFLCEECVKEKREPRFVIVLAARQQGWAVVKDHIKSKRYVGEDILGREIV